MKRVLTTAALAAIVSIAAVSCGNGAQIKAAQEQATKIVSAVPGAKVTVEEDGVAHLEGNFADEASKEAMIKSLEKVPGVKSVMDMAHVNAAPAAAASAPTGSAAH